MTDLPAATRVALLRRHGDFALAFSVATQDGLRHFGDGEGFIAYKTVGGTAFALADPIAPPPLRRALIERFVAAKRDVCFCQTTRATAAVLADLGFLVNELGTESRIVLPGFDFKGPAKRSFRTAQNRMQTGGFRIEERRADALDADEIATVSRRWNRTRRFRSQPTFLVRNLVLGDEPDVRRIFALGPSGRIVGFGVFDPVYDESGVAGYLYAQKRWLPEADPLVGYAILRHAVETFQGEGRRFLSLGLAPGADTHDRDFRRSWFVRRWLRFCYNNALFNRYVYPLRGHARHKHAIGEDRAQTYLAMNRQPELPRLLKLLWATRIV